MTAATIEAPLDLRAVWQRWRFPVIVIVLALAAAVALAAVENAPPQRPLDPRDASPVGARALAQLLQQRGVSVDAVASVPVDLADTTVFVPDPQSLTIAELAGLNASDADLVVVAPQCREHVAVGVLRDGFGGRPAFRTSSRSLHRCDRLGPRMDERTARRQRRRGARVELAVDQSSTRLAPAETADTVAERP